MCTPPPPRINNCLIFHLFKFVCFVLFLCLLVSLPTSSNILSIQFSVTSTYWFFFSSRRYPLWILPLIQSGVTAGQANCTSYNNSSLLFCFANSILFEKFKFVWKGKPLRLLYSKIVLLFCVHCCNVNAKQFDVILSPSHHWHIWKLLDCFLWISGILKFHYDLPWCRSFFYSVCGVLGGTF